MLLEVPISVQANETLLRRFQSDTLLDTKCSHKFDRFSNATSTLLGTGCTREILFQEVSLLLDLVECNTGTEATEPRPNRVALEGEISFWCSWKIPRMDPTCDHASPWTRSGGAVFTPKVKTIRAHMYVVV